MIGHLAGILLECRPPTVVVEVAGLGYEVDVPLSVLAALPLPGNPCRLYVHMAVREDAHLLFGFISRAERDAFRTLIRVNGIGPRLGLAVLSHMPLPELASCIARDDVNSLVRIPGVGRKTAERLMIELRDRLQPGEGEALTQGVQADALLPATAVEEAEAALVALGYRPAEAARRIKTVFREDATRDTLIRDALRGMVKTDS